MSSPCACANIARRCFWAAGPTPPFAAHGARTNIMSIRTVRNPRGKRTDEDSAAAPGRELLYTSASFSGQTDFGFRQIMISSVIVQNPPVLLPPKSACQPLSAHIADTAANPFPASAGSKGITHYTLPAKSCANRGAARPYWKPRAKGEPPLWIPYYFWQQWYPPSQSWVVSTLSKMKNLKNTFTMGWWFSDFPAWDIALFLQISMCPLWRKQKKERFSYDFIWSISRRLTWRKLI